jgi:hypothetical protein
MKKEPTSSPSQLRPSGAVAHLERSAENMMFAASFSKSVDIERTHLDPIRVGRVPSHLSTPDRYVTVRRNSATVAQIDVYSFGPDCFAFEEVIVWRELVILGFGSYVHAVSLVDRSVVTVELGSYFGHLYPDRDFVLLASGERLFRLNSDRSVSWKSADLGIDGVVVREINSTTIRGDGEWDPPGGWKPFEVSVVDGSLVR